MTPKASFGTGGWLAPGSSSYMTTGNTERGIAYNPVTGNLVLVSRAGGSNIRILDGNTGNDLGGLNNTGIAGGTFPVNMPGVAQDGSIYVCNLSTSAASPFTVYQWTDEASGLVNPPTAVYSAVSGITGTGDSFAVTGGTGGNPVIFAGSGSVPGTAGTNSCFVVGPVDGSNASTAYINVPGTTTSNNDYRLSMTFVDQDTLIGTQGANARMTSFNGTTATVDATIGLSAAQRGMSYAEIAGVPCLAVIDSNSSLVQVFDISNPSSPVLLTSGNATTGTLLANVNGTGGVAWGAIAGNTADLYAMNSNQGLQAFSVTIQRPAGATAYGVGCGSPALTLSASAAPILGGSYDLVTDNLSASTTIVAYGLGFFALPGGVPLPFGAGCSQYMAPDLLLFALPGGQPSNALTQTLPANAAFAGLLLYSQAVAFDASGSLTTSNGLELYLELF